MLTALSINETIDLMAISLSNKKGFTLIELMVAIAIVAVLATIGIIAFGATQKSARDAKRKGDLEDIKKALYLYRTNSGTFCTSGKGNCNLGIATHPFGVTSVLGSYWKTTPSDPTKGGTNDDYIILITSDDSFTVSAQLEGSASGGNSLGCTPYNSDNRPYNYCVGP